MKIRIGNEVNGVGSWHITDALFQATEFIDKTFHPDVGVLVHLDEVMKRKRLPNFIVNDRSEKALVREIGMYCRLKLPQLKRMVCCSISMRVFALRAFNLDACYDGGIDIRVDNCDL